jgi:hypothetical protein
MLEGVLTHILDELAFCHAPTLLAGLAVPTHKTPSVTFRELPEAPRDARPGPAPRAVIEENAELDAVGVSTNAEEGATMGEETVAVTVPPGSSSSGELRTQSTPTSRLLPGIRIRAEGDWEKHAGSEQAAPTESLPAQARVAAQVPIAQAGITPVVASPEQLHAHLMQVRVRLFE